MFSNKNSQYISVIKYHNQLKIDYKLLNQDEITSSNQTSFLLGKEFMPENVIFKLNTWQNESNHTFIATICDTLEQEIIRKDDSSKQEEFNIVALNENFNVGIKNSVLFEDVHYFDKTGLDFLYSPFHILNLHVEQNPSANHLLILLVDNHLYLLILNENNEIVFSCIKTLTSFDDIKETEFYESEVVGQKLFDEVYFFEIQNLIQSVISEFYEIKSDVFIEKIVILYTLKQLNDQQVHALQDELLIDIKYHPISIDESLFELSKQSLGQTKSFVQVRKKTTKNSNSKWVWLTLFTTLLTAALLYFFIFENGSSMSKKEEMLFEKINSIKKTLQIKKDTKNSEPIKKEELKNEEELKPQVLLLPNHIIKNRDIEKRLLTLFDIIPYDVLLKEISLKEDESSIEATFLKNDIFIKSMQTPLSKLYEYSEIKFDDDSATILNATISNNQRIKEEQKHKTKLPAYIKDEFLPQERVYEQLKAIFPKNGIIKFQSSFKSEVLTYNYTINVIVDTPLELFEIIEDINKELYSMNISYPVMLRKTIDGIEVEFNFQFHQYL